jgi:hypothetical protein
MSFDPSAPSNGAFRNPAALEGIDDWFVPGSAQPAASYPDDWIYPGNWNAPSPATASSAAPPAPSLKPNATNPATSDRPAPPADPFTAFWSLVPASRAGAMAWHPPIFPTRSGSFRQPHLRRATLRQSTPPVACSAA